MIEGATPKQQPEPGGAAPERPRRVVIVEDSRDDVLVTLMWLREAGVEARAVYSGLGVIEEVRDFQADAVFIDIGLPEPNGWEVARALRSEFGSRLLLVAVTAFGGQTDRMLSRLVGFDHHIVKPASPEQLLGLLNHSRAR